MGLDGKVCLVWAGLSNGPSQRESSSREPQLPESLVPLTRRFPPGLGA